MSRSAACDLIDGAWNRGLTPPPDLKVWEWMDEHLSLAGDSAESGVYRSERTPYIRGIAECLSPSHPARDISVCKGSQLGFTTLSKGWLAYLVDLMPVSTLIVLPTEKVAKEWSDQRLAELVESAPVLQGKIIDSRKRGSGNTTFWKRIKGTGAFLKIAWSTSPKKLKSTPAGNILSDEVDDFRRDTLAMLDRRSTTFQNAKHFKISTPEDEPSLIHEEFLKGDRRFYFLPCPHCLWFQKLDFARLKWETGNFESVRYVCVNCNQPIEERFKTQMLGAGRWVATGRHAIGERIRDKGFGDDDSRSIEEINFAMAHEKRTSFMLPSLYSPIGWESWPQIAQKWEEWKKTPKQLKQFINQVLAEPWVNRGEAPEWEALYARRNQDWEPGTKVPEGVLFLTAFADIQGNRIEVEVVGWGRKMRSWSIDYQVFRGNTAVDDPWIQLETYLATEFEHVNGAGMSIIALGVDTGHMASMAYAFALRHPQPEYDARGVRIRRLRTVVATKGGASGSKLLEHVSSEDSAKKNNGLRIFTIGTHYAKEEFVLGWLQAKPTEVDGKIVYPLGYCEFPNYEPWIFQGYCAESRVAGVRGTTWVKDPKFRNEPLDCRIGNRFIAYLYGADKFSDLHWAELERQLKAAAEPEEEKEPPPAFSSQQNGRRKRRARWMDE